MNADKLRTGTTIAVISFFLASNAAGQNPEPETPGKTNSVEQLTISEDISQSDSKNESKILGGISPLGNIQKMIREERIAALREIDIERKSTLAYMTKERQAVMGELQEELKRITALLQSERRDTMEEIEAMGNRFADNAILKSKKVIDHFFVRAFQFALFIIISVGMLSFIIVRFAAKRKTIK